MFPLSPAPRQSCRSPHRHLKPTQRLPHGRPARFPAAPGLIVALLAAVLALCARPVTAAFASPADWRDITIYQLITDRWDDGDPSNNTLNTTYNASAGDRTHGGDFKGIQRRLGYLEGLGVSAIWISPIPLNANGEYHGYSARDFTKVDPHWGTLADLQALVAACHARGIRVILDVVCNHGGNLFNDNPYVAPPASYTLTYRDPTRTHAAPFDSTAWWHAQGSMSNYVDPEQILGELFGLDDLKTEDPYVRTQLTNIWSNWITSTDVDGFRIDTVKHVEMGFWQTWAPGVRANATAFGKNNFFMFGEVFVGDEGKCGSYTGTKAGGAFALDSVLDYPQYYATNGVFATASNGAQAIVNHYNALPANYDPAAQNRLVTFLDNHDNPRFLSSSLANNKVARLHAALVHQLTSLGVPCVYYGSEQYFNGGNDPYCREDMFDGQFEFGPSLGNNFDQTSFAYRLVRKLNQLRRTYPSLRRGNLVVREVHSSPGVFAWSRTDSSEEVLVTVNTSDSAQTAQEWQTGFAPGTVLANVFEPSQTLTVNASQKVAAGTPIVANGYAVYVPKANLVDFEPEVVDVSVRQGDSLVTPLDPVTVTFSKAMNRASVESALAFDPAVTGTLTWNSASTAVTFTPTGQWPSLSSMRLTIAATAADTASLTLRGGFEREFQTVYSSGSTSSAPADPTIDGTIVGDPRWTTPVSIQTVQTGFGDNTDSTPDGNSGGSELDQLFVSSTTTTLSLGVAGNLEPNGNAIILMFDTNGLAGGANVLDGTGATSTWLGSQSNSAAGTKLPTGFTADIVLEVQAHTPNQTLTLYAYTFGADGKLASEDTVGNVEANPGFPTTGTITGTVNGASYTFQVALDNSHTGPVAAGSSAANPTGAGAATGLEISIPVALLGRGPYGIVVGLTGASGYWSNQFLPPMNAGSNRAWAPDLTGRGITPLTYYLPVTLSRVELD
jgi:alpha-amylase